MEAPATAPSVASGAVGLESLVTLKVIYNDNTRRFKVPLRDLGPRVFPQKVCHAMFPPEASGPCLDQISIFSMP